MRVVLQRVAEASVTIEGRVAGSIGHGLLLLVAFTAGDGNAQVEWMAEKIAGLRVFLDEDGRMNRGMSDVQGAVLVV